MAIGRFARQPITPPLHFSTAPFRFFTPVGQYPIVIQALRSHFRAMQHNTLTFPSLPSAGGERDLAFNVVIAYEDFETGKNAKKTYDFLVEHLGDECAFNNQMWKFDVLSLPKLREMAIGDATQADIIIISAHGTNDLPSQVKTWIEQSITGKPHAIALVGLFDTESCQNHSCEYLAEVARRGGMEFFSQPGVWPGGEKGATIAAPEGHRADKTISVLAELVQQDSNNSQRRTND